MLYNNINISRLIVHAQQVEESKISRKNRESKKERSYEGGFSKGRVDIQEKPRFKKSFLIKFLQNFPRLVMIGYLTLSPKRE